MMFWECLDKEKGQQSSLWSTAGTLYQVLMDKERMFKLRQAIESVIKNGDIVVDIGTGSGILAYFAIVSGAKFVYAIELDPSNYKTADTVVKDNNMMEAIKLIQGDAFTIKLPEKADVLICELMSTALLDEPQISLMNHGINKFLKKNGITIPKRATTFIECVNTNYFNYGIKLRVPQYEWEWIDSHSRKLSETVVMFEVDFSTMNKEDIHCRGSIEIIQDGLLNGIRLTTKTYFTEEITHSSSMGFCPPVVIPTKEESSVKTGDIVGYELSYKAGYGYSSMQIHIFKNSLRLAQKDKTRYSNSLNGTHK